jgi:hypothetical protein
VARGSLKSMLGMPPRLCFTTNALKSAIKIREKAAGEMAVSHAYKRTSAISFVTLNRVSAHLFLFFMTSFKIERLELFLLYQEANLAKLIHKVAGVICLLLG